MGWYEKTLAVLFALCLAVISSSITALIFYNEGFKSGVVRGADEMTMMWISGCLSDKGVSLKIGDQHLYCSAAKFF